MRKLASIQRIWAIEPIEGADRIEMARVLGWQCVVNKGQFKPGDLAVYFEIDSFLPVRPEFEFLRASSYKKTDVMGEGFKLKTMKFRGQISQGLLLPISLFPEIHVYDPGEQRVYHPGWDASLGCDVTDLLGVKKYEIEERATTGGTIKGELPPDVPHTDETRIQAEPMLAAAFEGLEYYISTKMDGTSCSLSIDDSGFHVTGHNYEYKDDGSNSFYEFIKSRGYQQSMQEFMRRNSLKLFTIQGEFCAPGIQKNRLKLTRPEWYVFTIRVNGKRIGLDDMLMICDELHMTHVPIEEIGDNLLEKYPTVESLLARADGDYPNGGKKEGIVIRPCKPVYSPLISAPLSMKVINNKYILKNDA